MQNLTIGDLVEINSGIFKGKQAIITKITNHRCQISIESIGYSLVAFVDMENLNLLRPKIEKIEKSIANEIQIVNKNMLAHFSENPDELYKINPYTFEEIVAELLLKMGYEITLTQRSRDDGRDILALFNSPAGKILTIVDCKRYKESRKIGSPIVERFLWTSERKDKASKAMLVTTSFYTSEARKIEREYIYRLSLKDFHDLKKWIVDYGTVSNLKNSKYWSPLYLKEEL